jgi:hypothetical protein
MPKALRFNASSGLAATIKKLANDQAGFAQITGGHGRVE